MTIKVKVVFILFFTISACGKNGQIDHLFPDRTNKLLNKLGIMETVLLPLPVTDIFNFEKDNQYRPVIKKAVGFGS